MQHIKDCASRRSVANAAEAEDLLHRKPESHDVGALEKSDSLGRVSLAIEGFMA
jgi:hypothetical protein